MASFDENGSGNAEEFDDPNKKTGQTPKENDDSPLIEYNGRKMTREEVLSKLENADKHISTLEDERKTDRERLEKLIETTEKSQKEQEELSEIVKRLQPSEPKPSEKQESPDYDKVAEQAAQLAYNRMTEEQKREQQRQNQESVKATLQERYGDKVDDEVFSITRELGYTDEEAFELAGTRPKAFLKMVGIDGTQQPNKGANSTHSSTRNPPESGQNGDQKPPKVHGATTSKERLSAWEERVTQKLKSLGLEN